MSCVQRPFKAALTDLSLRNMQPLLCVKVFFGYQKYNVFNFIGQHPQIQKKSQYIKYLCCDDVRTLHQWVNGIRIAKVRSQPFLLILPYVFSVMHTNIHLFFILSLVREATVWKLPGGHEENGSSLRLVLSLYLQYQIRLQFCQHTR